MIFKKFNSIENSYRQKEIDGIIINGFAKGDWVATEKVHGSNLSFWYDGERFRIAKRTCFIGDSDNFYNAPRLLDEHKAGILLIWEDLNLKKGEDTLAIYGEVFGGVYKHPDVQRDPYSTQVQSGIYYSPFNMFYAFALTVNDVHLDFNVRNELFTKASMFHALALYVGTFDECLKVPTEFQTTIPGLLGFPKIENNFAEGVVLSPMKEAVFNCGSRVILKNKNPRFSENIKGPKENKSQDVVPDSDELNEIKDSALEYINENRLRAVLSKIGPVTDKMFGKIMGEFSQDVLKDFKTDYEDEVKQLSSDDTRKLNKFVNERSSRLIKENFLNILDGGF